MNWTGTVVGRVQPPLGLFAFLHRKRQSGKPGEGHTPRKDLGSVQGRIAPFHQELRRTIPCGSFWFWPALQGLA